MEKISKLNTINESSDHGEEYKRKLRMALFTAFISLAPQNAESAEIPTQASWSKGADVMKTLALSEKNEFASIYIKGIESGVWQNVVEGTHDSVGDSAEEHESLQKIDDKSVANFLEKNNDDITVCDIHTHPKALDWSPGGGYSSGVSLSDLKTTEELNQRLLNVSDDFGVEIKTIGAVFDRNGVWYFSGYKPSAYDAEVLELQNNIEKVLSAWLITEISSERGVKLLSKINEIYNSNYNIEESNASDLVNEILKERGDEKRISFDADNGRLNVSGLVAFLYDHSSFLELREYIDDFANKYSSWNDYFSASGLLAQFTHQLDAVEDSKKQEVHSEFLPKLYDLYSKRGAKVRFVSYDLIDAEPPCAGPDYIPQTK